MVFLYYWRFSFKSLQVHYGTCFFLNALTAMSATVYLAVCAFTVTTLPDLVFAGTILFVSLSA